MCGQTTPHGEFIQTGIPVFSHLVDSTHFSQTIGDSLGDPATYFQRLGQVPRMKRSR